jgi:hypothetical protein
VESPKAGVEVSEEAHKAAIELRQEIKGGIYGETCQSNHEDSKSLPPPVGLYINPNKQGKNILITGTGAKRLERWYSPATNPWLKLSSMLTVYIINPFYTPENLSRTSTIARIISWRHRSR